MSGQYWVKVYCEVLNDPKVGKLPLALRWRFIEALLLVGSITPPGQVGDGKLPPLEDACFMAHASQTELTEAWEELEDAKLMSRDDDGAWQVNKYAERQGPADSTQRVRTHRQRETLLKRSRNVIMERPDTESDTDTDTDTELIKRVESETPDPFDVIRIWIESATGTPSSPRDVPALQELAALGDLIETDITNAVVWHRENGRVVYGASQLVGSIKYNRLQRIQAGVRKTKTAEGGEVMGYLKKLAGGAV